MENAIHIIQAPKDVNEMKNAVKMLREGSDFLKSDPPLYGIGYKYMSTVKIMQKAALFIEKESTQMTREILAIVNDLPHRFNCNQKPYPTLDDFGLYLFEQVWGSTALGFEGIGGQAITSARTYVFVPTSCDERCFVYFGGRFAYAAPYSDVFMADVAAGRMAPVAMSGKYCKQ